MTRTLGKGGFGTTWAATDRENGAAVAIKALDLSRVDDWKAVELFEREAQTLEQLNHPNIPGEPSAVGYRCDPRLRPRGRPARGQLWTQKRITRSTT